MKRTFLFVILCIILVSITGCNGSGGGKGQNSDNPQSEDPGTVQPEDPETPQQTDTEAPSVPAKPLISVSGSGTSSDPLSVQIVWQASTDNKGVKNYSIYRNGAFFAGSTVPLFTDTGISETERYCYSVSAIDEAGNESGRSEPACFNGSAGKIKWEFRTEGDSSDMINTAPVSDSKGNVYFADKKFVYCVRNDGTLDWKFTMSGLGYDAGWFIVDDEIDQSGDIQDVMAIGSDDSVYILSGNYLNALSPEGSLKWKIPVDDDGIHGVMECDGKRLSTGHDGTVYLFSDRFLNALNPDGSTRWQKERKENLPSSMHIAPDDSVYFIDDSSLVAIKSDGSVKWKWGDRYCAIKGISDDGTVYCAYRYNSLTALTPEGAEKWEINHGHDNGVLNGYVSKINRDGTVYYCMEYFVALPPPAGGYKYRKFFAYSADGALMWSRNSFDPGNADLIKDHGIYIKNGTGFDRYNPLDGNLISHYDNILSGFTEDADGNIYAYSYNSGSNESIDDQSLSGQPVPGSTVYFRAFKPDGTVIKETPLSEVYMDGDQDGSFSYDPLVGNDGAIYLFNCRTDGSKAEYTVTAVHSVSE